MYVYTKQICFLLHCYFAELKRNRNTLTPANFVIELGQHQNNSATACSLANRTGRPNEETAFDLAAIQSLDDYTRSVYVTSVPEMPARPRGSGRRSRMVSRADNSVYISSCDDASDQWSGPRGDQWRFHSAEAVGYRNCFTFPPLFS